MKKIIFTESQIKGLLNRLITEDEETLNFNKAIQCFLKLKFKINLNIDGIMGQQTTPYIQKYQGILGIDQDGIWGDETERIMKLKFPNDFNLFKQCKRKFVPLFPV
jgi:peptidoglycan hydrolase-like protein with peptidoglycan-binding domain